MSVFLEDDILTTKNRRSEQLLELPLFQPGSSLAYLELDYFRLNDQVVTRRPIDAFPGHANVRDRSGRRSGGKMTRMAKASKWLVPPFPLAPSMAPEEP